MKSFVIVILVLSAMLLLLMSVILGIGLGAGLLLHWFVPSIELGTATVCGTIATGMGIAFCVAIAILIEKLMKKATAIDTNYTEDSEVLTEDQVDEIAEQLVEAFLLRTSPPSVRAKPKTNRSR